jgi:hypothetical protein
MKLNHIFIEIYRMIYIIFIITLISYTLLILIYIHINNNNINNNNNKYKKINKETQIQFICTHNII